jgi:hypothetical protein
MFAAQGGFCFTPFRCHRDPRRGAAIDSMALDREFLHNNALFEALRGGYSAATINGGASM